MNSLLPWFDNNPDRYSWFVCVVLSAASYIALRPLFKKTDSTASTKSDWRWGWAILAVLVAGRWPMLFVPFELNLDESQLIAGAINLRHDPVFWRSVDGGTAGPLDFYALLPAGSLLGHDSFFSARLTALLLIASALLFVHQAATRVFGRDAARLGGMSTLLFEALTLHTDFLHYSTELVSLSLLAAAFYVGIRLWTEETSRNSTWFWFGLLLGAAPFAKLQSGPIAATLGLFFLAVALFSRKQPLPVWRQLLISLTAGAMTPCLFFGGLTVITGEARNAVTPYLLNNLFYAGSNQQPITETAATLIHATARDGALIHEWLLSGIGLGLVVLLALRRSWPVALRGRFIAATAAFLAASIFCIVTPHRSFPHYLQFLMVPWALLLCAITGLAWKIRENCRSWLGKTILTVAMLGVSGAIIYRRAGIIHPVVGSLQACVDQPKSPLAQAVIRYAQPTESVAVWGWMPQLFVETNLRMATRAGNNANEIFPGPYQQFFRQRYLADFRRSFPPVFIDATGNPKSVLRDRAGTRHEENFPELAAFVRAHYTQITEIDGSRIYVRNDRLDSSLSNNATPLVLNSIPPPAKSSLPPPASLLNTSPLSP